MKKNMRRISQHYSRFSRLIPMILLIIPFFLNSCGFGGGVSGDLVTIPKDVSYVIGIDFKNISSKSQDWQTVINEDFIGGIESQIETSIRDAQRYYKTILNSGINFGQKAYLFGSLSESQKDYVAFAFLLQDPSAFEKALLKDDPELKTQSNQGITYVYKEEVMIGWKGNSALMLGNEANPEEAAIFEQMVTLFENEETLNNKAYKTIMNGGHDYALWIDQQQINSLSPEFEMGEDADIFTRLLSTSNYTTISQDFEKGQVSIRFKAYLDGEKSKEFQSALQKGLDPKLIKSIPIAEPSLMMALDSDPNTLYESLENEYYMRDLEEGLAEDLEEMGYTLKDLFQALDGNIFLVAGDLHLEKYFQFENNFDSDFTIVAGVKDQDLLDELMSKLTKKGEIQDKGDYYTAPNPDGEGDYNLIPKSGALYITLSEELRANILAGKSALKPRYQDISKDKSFLLFLNLNSLISQIPERMVGLIPYGYGPAIKNDIAPELEGLWLDVSPAKNDELDGQIILSFVNKDENSLVSLVKIAKRLKEREDLSLAQ